jgi:soluble lytic murein transglycosylase-like protein
MAVPHSRSATRNTTGRLRAARHIASLLLSGLCFAAAPPVAVLAQNIPQTRPVSTDPHAAFIAEASQRFDIPQHWIRAVRRVESAGDVRAISSAGAMGLMQIMPDTWAELRTRHGLGRDPYDPRDNILAGTAYLREMHDRYGSPGFLAAYNAGPGRYEEYLAGRPLPAETRAYVAILAPLIGGDELAPTTRGNTVVATADPNAWRQAPLFVTPFISGSDATRRSQAEHPNGVVAAPEERAEPVDAQQSGALFVVRAGEGNRP